MPLFTRDTLTIEPDRLVAAPDRALGSISTLRRAAPATPAGLAELRSYASTLASLLDPWRIYRVRGEHRRRGVAVGGGQWSTVERIPSPLRSSPNDS